MVIIKKSPFILLYILFLSGFALAQEAPLDKEAYAQTKKEASKANYDYVYIDLTTGESVSRMTSGFVTALGFSISEEDDEAVLLSEPILVTLAKADPFLAVAGTWLADGEYPEQIRFDLRFSPDGHEWSAWEETEMGHATIDDGLHYGDLVFTDKETQYVQFRLVINKSKDGASPIISRAGVHFISPGASDESLLRLMEEKSYEARRMQGAREEASDVRKKNDYGEKVAGYPQPGYVARTSWGALYGLTNTASRTITAVTHLVVHHSAGQTYSSDFPAVVRSYWNHHVNTHGWADIGYQWLTDRNGVIYQGRAFATNGNTNVQGAHAGGFNVGSMGVCVIGDYTNEQPSTAGFNAMNEVFAWKADERGIDPLASAWHSSSGTTRPTIAGHRDVGTSSTTCPGNAFHAMLPAIRTAVNNLIQGTATGTLSGAIYHGDDIGDLSNRIEGATVTLNTGASTTSGSNGMYSFELEPGSYTVTASMSGFESASLSRTVNSSETTWGSIQLTPIQEADVVWSRMGSGAPGTLPSWFGDHSERGMAIYWKAARPYMLIQSAVANSDNTAVYFVDASTGDDAQFYRFMLPDGSELPLDGLNQSRTTETAILYNHEKGNDTGTNQHGIEIGMQLQSTSGNMMHFEVVDVAYEEGSMAIPDEDFYVVSGHGTRKDYLWYHHAIGNLNIGSQVSIKAFSQMDLSAYDAGGTFHLSDIAVSQDNRIFLANYTRDGFDDYGRFRVHMYENPTDTSPQLVLDDTRPDGDASWFLARTFTLTGNFAEGTATIYALADGSSGASRNLIRYTQSGPGEPFDTSSPYTTTVMTQMNPTASAALTGTAAFYTTSRGQPVRKYDADRTWLGNISSDVVADYAHRVQFLGTTTGGDDYIAVFSPQISSEGDTEHHRAKLIRVGGGDPANAQMVMQTRTWSRNSNPNFGGDVRFFYDGSGFDAWILSTNNGLSHSYFDYSVNIPDIETKPSPEPLDVPEIDFTEITEIPWYEDFSGVVPEETHGGEFPEGWHTIGDVMVSKWGGTDNSTVNIRFLSPTEEPLAITPAIHSDIDISELELGFRAHYSSGDAGDKIHVGFISNLADPGSFHPVTTISLSGTFDAYAVDLSGHMPEHGRRIAFKAERGAAYNAHYVGKISLDIAPVDVESTVAGAAGWRMLAAPVAGGTIENLAAQNQIQGIPGTEAFYGASAPEGIEDAVPNIFTSYENGQWFAPSHISEELMPGKGFIWYLYDNDDGVSVSLPFSLSLAGAAARENITLDISGSNDHFVLAGNPFPEGLDISGIGQWANGGSLRSSIVQVWRNDPQGWQAGSGHQGAWELVGAGNNNNLVAAWQGFLVENKDAGEIGFPVSAQTDGGVLFRPKNATSKRLVLQLDGFRESDSVRTTDKAHLLFHEDAKEGWDLLDASKHIPLSSLYAIISFIGPDNGGYTRKVQESRPVEFEGSFELPVDFDTHNMSGVFTLSWSGVEEMREEWDFLLTDTETGITTDLREQEEYVFTYGSQKAFIGDDKPKNKKEPGTGKDFLAQEHLNSNGDDARFRLFVNSEPVSEGAPADIPEKLALSQNYPNPFNTITMIRYELPEELHATIEVFDMLGQKVAVLADGKRSAGSHSVRFDASGLSSGIYLYRLEAEGKSLTRRMTLIK